MRNQLNAGTYVECSVTVFDIVIAEMSATYIETKLRSCSYVNTCHATQSEVILQVYRDFNGLQVLVVALVFIFYLSARLCVQCCSVNTYADNRNSKLSHRTDKEAGTIVRIDITGRECHLRDVQTAFQTEFQLRLCRHRHHKACHQRQC